MSFEQARRPVKATVLGFALAAPLLAGCAYDDGYYGPPANYGYGYGYYGYGYGNSCGWPYDCDRWRHRHHRHHHDDGDGHGGGNKPPVHAGGPGSDIPPEIVRPPRVEPPRSPRVDRRGSPPSQIWIPQQRDSRR